jgi:hypothetical protein
MSATQSLKYKPLINLNQYTKVLLIDNSVPNCQTFFDSANETTFPIVYSWCSTKSELANLLSNFTTINRLALCFTSNGPVSQTFLDNELLFLNNETEPFSENTRFIINTIKEYKIANIDFLACNTLRFIDYEKYYNILTEQTGVVVGASNDKTGNMKYGGDWVLESTGQDIESVYFTESIEYYQYLLDTVINNFPIINVNGINMTTTYVPYRGNQKANATNILINGTDLSNLFEPNNLNVYSNPIGFTLGGKDLSTFYLPYNVGLSNAATSLTILSSTSTSVTISFTAPTTNGTIVGYEPYLNGVLGTGSGTPSSYTITGLTPNIPYTININVIANLPKTNIITTTSSILPTSIPNCQLWFDAADNATLTFGQLTPNSTAATTASWTNNGITWTASASESANANCMYYSAFNFSSYVTGGDPGAVLGWQNANIDYASSPWNYNGTGSTTYYINSTTTNTKSGGWLQIQSGVSLLLNSYTFTGPGGTGNGALITRIPGKYTIVGSTNGTTWYNLVDVVFTGLPSGTTNTAGVQTTGSILLSTLGTITASTTANTNSTTTTYGYQTGYYTYFRIIFTNTLAATVSSLYNVSATGCCQFGWTPTFISNTNISQWNDKSGNSYSVVQPTIVNQPKYTTNLLNSKPGIVLSTSSWLYQLGSNIPNFSSSTATTIFMVARNDSSLPTSGWSIPNTMWFDSAGNSATLRYHLSFANANTPGVTSVNNNITMINQSTTVAAGANAIIGLSWSTTSGLIYVNGQTATFAGETLLNANNSNTRFNIGDARGGFVRDIAVYEMLGFSSQLTTTQQQQIEGYLAWKWGLQTSLPVGHPYYSAAPVTTSTSSATSYSNANSILSTALTTTLTTNAVTNIQLLSSTTTSITVSFTAPTAGTTPTSYTPNINGSTGSGSGTYSSYTITGLSTNNSYTIGIAANYTTGSVFTPTQVTGCQLWFDAADPLNTGTAPSNGTSITTWYDKSGSSRNATANTGITYNTTGLNSKPALTFTNTQWLTGPVPITTNTLTVFAVISMDSRSPGYARLISLAAPGVNDYISNSYLDVTRPTGTATGFFCYRNGNLAINNPPSFGPYLYVFSFDGTNNYNITYIGNSTITTSVASTGNFGISSFAIANNTNTADGCVFYGFMSEILVYNTSLSTSDRQKVEGFLSWKWGLQTNLPNTHPYYSASSNNLSTTTVNSSTVSLSTLPNAPTITGYTSTINSITVNFTAPSGNITGYTASAGAGLFTVSGASTSVTITGLSSNTSYSITLYATVGSVNSANATTTALTIPDASTIVIGTTSSTSTSITVPFTGPSGNGSITGYTATINPGSIVQSFSASPLSVTSGLSAGTSYTITITASNSSGTSSNNATTNVSTTVQISPPTNLVFISASDTTITLSFTAPTGTITSYTPYVNNVQSTGSGTASSYTITGLTANTSYSVTMTATSGGTESSKSTAVTMYTAISSSGLILRYTGDVGTNSGTNLNNQLYSGNVSNATLLNSAAVGNTSVFKQGTGSMYFPTRSTNQSGSCIKVTSSFSLASSGYVSVAFWVYPTYSSTSWDWYYMFATSGGGYFGMQFSGGTNLSLAINGGNFLNSSNTTVTLNTWTHIVAIYSITGGTCYFYKNNSLVGTGNSNSSIASYNLTNNYIGTQGQTWGDPTFQGYMDEFRVYTRLLSTQEITSLYNLTG